MVFKSFRTPPFFNPRSVRCNEKRIYFGGSEKNAKILSLKHSILPKLYKKTNIIHSKESKNILNGYRQ